MYFFPLGIIINLLNLALAGLASSAAIYVPQDEFAVNCGSSVNSAALDGREWLGDTTSKFVSSSPPTTVSSTTVHSPFLDSIPYMTARISRSQFTYAFQVSPGQKFIRLHFRPAQYRGFEKSKALFAVRAGPYTLLTNFTASLPADALGGVRYSVKEYCVNVGEDDRVLSIKFSPSPASPTDDVYAFINGIEIVSMPTGLYYSADDDLGPQVAGKKYRFYIDNSSALESVYRLNVGGRSILPPHDLGMFRLWTEDKNYLLDSDVLPVSTATMIKYADTWDYAGPPKLYQTAWALGSNRARQPHQRHNYTWKLPVDFGFRYLVRLHFCDHKPRISKNAGKQFAISINNQIAENEADVIKWSGGSRVPVYRDYVVMMKGDRMGGKCDLFIRLQPLFDWSSKHTEVMILNGIEIFKLSNPDDNLAGLNLVSPAHASTLWTSRFGKLVAAFGHRNAIATGVVFILALLNIAVFQLTNWNSNNSQTNILLSLHEEEVEVEEEEEEEEQQQQQGCRLFSLVEIQLATNNFDEKFVIGRGGFGKVYRGVIDGGTRTLAIKRLNPKSNQGADQFWAEVETLSKIQHTHLVSLFGYYEDRWEMILVYEYMPNGSLADHLYGNSNSSPLSWDQRLNICIGGARGLSYLHNGRGAGLGIIHRDVKSSNILLDENWVAKISDFGLSKMFDANPARTHITTKQVKGTFGYMDVDYIFTHRVTEKLDVYAFGVVLFEVLCGRAAVDVRLDDEEQHSLALWARQCVRRGSVDIMVDSSVREQISPNCMKVFVEIAGKCLHEQPKERPSMKDVVGRLEYALELQGRPISYLEGCLSCTGTDFGQPVTEGNVRREDSSSSKNLSFGAGNKSEKVMGRDLREERTVGPAPKTTKRKDKDIFPKWKKHGSESRWWHWHSRWTKLKPSKAQVKGMEFCRRFSLSQIRTATDNFNDCCIIGKGGFGNVYAGHVEGRAVAIKRLIPESKQGEREFLTEIQVLPLLSHTHLVSLLGYCNDKREMILVYNYIDNGTLRDHLYGSDNDPLPWKQRLHICIGVARGLHYMHEHAQPPVIHRDVKSTNILLDHKWAPKITDFGLSKARPNAIPNFPLDTMVKGTFGYIDPEYYRRQELTEKCDVYGLGVVLLEVLCARKPVDRNLEASQQNLVNWVQKCIQDRTVDRMVDPYLLGSMAGKCLSKFVEVTERCLRHSGVQRPSMAEVVRELEFALYLQETAEGERQGDGLDLDAELSFRKEALDDHPSDSSSTCTASELSDH